MQLEYIFRKTGHERHGQTCVIYAYSNKSNDDTITVMFEDGVMIDVKRVQVIDKTTMAIRKGRKETQVRAQHPPYDLRIQFYSFAYNRDKLKKYLKRHNITMNDLFNNFISNL